MRTTLIAMCIVLAACSKQSGSPVVGTWTIDVTASTDKRMEVAKGAVTVNGPAEEQQMFADMMKEELAKQFREASETTKLGITAEGRYTLSYRAGSDAIEETGTWTEKDKGTVFTLTCERVNRKTCPRAKTLRLDAKSQTATFEDPAAVLAGKLHAFGNALVIRRQPRT
jgi:hypothetical protein